MAELVWTEESERWLRDIFEYISADNPMATEGVVNGIYDRAQTLLMFPESGYRYQGSTEDIRILRTGTTESRTKLMATRFSFSVCFMVPWPLNGI